MSPSRSNRGFVLKQKDNFPFNFLKPALEHSYVCGNNRFFSSSGNTILETFFITFSQVLTTQLKKLFVIKSDNIIKTKLSSMQRKIKSESREVCFFLFICHLQVQIYKNRKNCYYCAVESQKVPHVQVLAGKRG